MTDEVYFFDDEKKKPASEEADRQRHQEIEDIRFMLGTPAGRRFFLRLFNIAGVFKSSFTGTSHTFFYEGQRNVGLRIMSDVRTVDRKAIEKMLIESEGEKDV